MERVAIIGASSNKERYSYKAQVALSEHGHTPFPVSRKDDAILGVACNKMLSDITEEVETVTMYVGPQHQGSILKEIIAVKPKRVIFNPGTENPQAYAILKEADIDPVEACTLVMLATDQF